MVEWNAAQYTQISALKRSMADEVLALLDLKRDGAGTRYRLR